MKKSTNVLLTENMQSVNSFIVNSEQIEFKIGEKSYLSGDQELILSGLSFFY